jgi:Phage P22-like portal protein
MENKDEFLELARKRFIQARDEEAEIRKEALEDLQFVAGEQWDQRVKRERENAGRPALTHNRLQAFCAQVENEARQQKPQIRFSPVEDADEDTAEIYEGLARHIQYDSRASIAYENAVVYQTGGGFGFFRLLADYCDGESFDQELKIESIPDPFSVYGLLTPAIRGQKARYAFVVTTISRDEYKAQFGEKDEDEISNFADSDGDGWVTKDYVRIAEYWRLETRNRTIALLEDGSVVDADQVPEGVPIVKTRTVDEDVVRFCKIDGHRILPDSETEWVTPNIPIYPVLGKSLIVDGKPQLFSLIRFQRDPQKLINYTKSRIAESLATAPISPYIGAEGQFAGHEREWATANTTLRPYLEYKATNVLGQPVPPPQRQVYEPPIQALSVFLAQEIDELKAISGIFDASLGNESNETSGVAIARRQQQSNTANLHFLDNLTRAHESCGRDIAAAIPQVYDTARMVRILGTDEEQKIVKVNQLHVDEQGVPRHYQLSAGKYDVAVTQGRSISTKRLETFESISQLVQAQPQLLQVLGDVLFRNSDMAGADEISERFKKLLPPPLQEQQGQPQVPPQFQAAMQQLGQQHDALVQQLHAVMDQLESKNADLELKRYTVDQQERTKREIALAQLNSGEALRLLENDLAAVKHQLDMMHQASLKQADQEHQAAMQQADQRHALMLQQGAQQHALNMQAVEPSVEPGAEEQVTG